MMPEAIFPPWHYFGLIASCYTPVAGSRAIFELYRYKEVEMYVEKEPSRFH